MPAPFVRELPVDGYQIADTHMEDKIRARFGDQKRTPPICSYVPIIIIVFVEKMLVPRFARLSKFRIGRRTDKDYKMITRFTRVNATCFATSVDVPQRKFFLEQLHLGEEASRSWLKTSASRRNVNFYFLFTSLDFKLLINLPSRSPQATNLNVKFPASYYGKIIKI